MEVPCTKTRLSSWIRRLSKLGDPLGIGMAAEFMNNLGFYAAPVQEAGAPEVEIHDLIYEDELLDADDALVVLE